MVKSMRFFLPRQLVFWGVDQQPTYFAVRFCWDGGFSLVRQKSLIIGKPFVLLLDSALPFRRNFQFSIQQRVKREFILASAAGLFPFALDDYVCSLGVKDSKSYLFALKKCDYDAIVALVGQPAAVLVSDFDELAMVLAMKSWLNNRSVYALTNLLLPVDSAKLLTGILITIGLLVMILSWSAWMSHFQDNEELMRQQAIQITKKAEPLLHKRMVVSHMQSVYKAVDKLTENSSEKLLRQLMPFLEALPVGCYVEKIQFDNGRLEVVGWGNIPAAWFIDHGFSDKDYEVEDFPKINRFIFWIAND